MFATITLLCCLAALTLFGVAAWTDRMRRLIANRISLALCVLFLGWAGAGWIVTGDWPVPPISHLSAAAATFAIAFALWSARLFGGGDVKLLTAVALWAGWQWLAPVILLVTLAGAVMALLQLALSRLLPHTAELVFGGATEGAYASASALAEADETTAGGNVPAAPARPTVPYGVAIAVGGAWVVIQIVLQFGIG